MNVDLVFKVEHQIRIHVVGAVWRVGAVWWWERCGGWGGEVVGAVGRGGGAL